MQALPLVSTIWGVVLFGEYFRSSKRTYILLVRIGISGSHSGAQTTGCVHCSLLKSVGQVGLAIERW